MIRIATDTTPAAELLPLLVVLLDPVLAVRAPDDRAPWPLSPGKWQLDVANDWWARELDGELQVSCRYSGQAVVLASWLRVLGWRVLP